MKESKYSDSTNASWPGKWRVKDGILQIVILASYQSLYLLNLLKLKKQEPNNQALGTFSELIGQGVEFKFDNINLEHFFEYIDDKGLYSFHTKNDFFELYTI